MLIFALALSGCGGGPTTLNEADTKTVNTGAADVAYAAIRKAELDTSSDFTDRLIEDAAYPSVAVDSILTALGDEKADTAIKSPIVAPEGEEEITVSAYLAELASNVANSWPEDPSEVEAIDRVRESLPQ
jgi:hypothetical protein